MINTYHTSVAPPPVPPRLNSHLLIPAPLPSPKHSKTLIRFLVCIVVLHLLLSFGGFIYLYQTEKMDRPPSAEGKAELQTSVKQETFHRALAGMVVGRKTAERLTSGHLQWDMNHSVLRNINYFNGSWLTVMQSGDYYVYSRVTFSKSHPTSPLYSTVMLRESKSRDEKILMKAYCSLGTHTGNRSVPRLCTATQGAVVTLEKGNQLSVWIEHLSLVDYDETATAFGMYKL
ncbi:CD40 ligand [Paralichthys olivaceus]|uniref:Fas ligand n=1 Tax=Paralichthys olivaceus TaxID=8255 RepID=Q4W6D7_PAROL|nr:Fas ligand [Paralichthys olivaceus]BAD99014.1 Fas ligand [Paralichthys olivaceus]